MLRHDDEAAAVARSHAQLLSAKNELQAGGFEDSSVIGSFRVYSISALSSLEDELLVLQQQSVVDLAATQRPALLDPRGFPRCTFKGP